MVWLHNDKEIKPSKDFEYDSAGDLYTLKMAEIFPEDSGCYTCEAFNDAGESFSSCTLVVLGEAGLELQMTWGAGLTNVRATLVLIMNQISSSCMLVCRPNFFRVHAGVKSNWWL